MAFDYYSQEESTHFLLVAIAPKKNDKQCQHTRFMLA